jgi:proteasome assembly chaperone (PAC2) family protein
VVKSSGTHQSNRVSLIEPREFYVHRVSLIEPREFYVYRYRLWIRESYIVIVIGIVQSLDLYCDYKCFGIFISTVESFKLYQFGISLSVSFRELE